MIQKLIEYITSSNQHHGFGFLSIKLYDVLYESLEDFDMRLNIQ